MKAKGEDELSGLEYYAWSKFKEQKTEWIPIGETLYLKGISIHLDSLLILFLDQEEEAE